MTDQTVQSNSLAKKGVLKIGFRDDKTLYDCYMPFVKGCGLFVPTNDDYHLGDEAFLLINLPNEKGKFATSAKIVWINSKQKMGKRIPGIGLQITGKDSEKIKSEIESILGKRIKSPLSTYTM